MDPKLVKHPVLQSIAKEKDKNVVQVILRWNYQNHVLPIIKSSNKGRMESNFNIFDFELTPAEMANIEDINENYRVRHDPDNCDFSKL